MRKRGEPSSSPSPPPEAGAGGAMEGSTSMMTEQQDVPQAGTSEAGVAKRTTVQQQQHRDAAHMEDDEEAEDTMLREERMSSLAGRGWRFDADIRDGVTVQESVVSSRYIHAALRPAVQPGFFVFTLMDQRRPPTEPPGQGGSGAVLVAQASENLQELVGLRAPQVLGKAIADLLASEEDMCRLIACLDEAKTRGMDTAPYRDPPRWMEISMPFIAPDAVLQERVTRALSSGAEDMETSHERLNQVYARWVHTVLHVKGASPSSAVQVVATISLTNDPYIFHLTMERKEGMVGPFPLREDVLAMQVLPPIDCAPPSLSPTSAAAASLPAPAPTALQRICDDALELVYRATEADRIMIYRFAAEDFHGEVIGERLIPGSGLPMMGLHFPALDIPIFARMLFMRVPVRIIPDVVGHHMVPLFPRRIQRSGPGTSEDGDIQDEAKDDGMFAPEMAECPARAVSGCHTKYLENMAVRSSCVIPIIVSGTLWGLISVQHLREPVRLSFWSRSQCVAAGMALSRQLLHVVERDTFACSLRFEQLAMSSMLNSNGVAGFFERAHGELLQQLDACALSIKCSSTGGDILHYGAGVPPASMAQLLNVLGGQGSVKDAPEGICCINCLSQHTGRLGLAIPVPDEFSGAAFISTHYFILVIVRHEFQHTVSWAGQQQGQLEVGMGHTANPDERLNPRSSFELWKETRRGMCKPWSLADRAVLRGLRLKTHFVCANMMHHAGAALPAA